MRRFPKSLRITLIALSSLFAIGLALGIGIVFQVSRDLPDIETLRDVRLQVPLRVYSRDGVLLSEFGEMKRTPVRYADVPPLVIQAVLAAEDDRFFEHPGVDYQGILRAAMHLVLTGEKVQGGSTITMQVARNFFLSSEKTYLRKLKEIVLALKIDRDLAKEEILELYLNKIYLGNRAYGVAAAAQIYYGKQVRDLELPEIAMIAGLPKAPSLFNPAVNPQRARQRRDYVLKRMEELGFIDAKAAEKARNATVSPALYAAQREHDAAHLAEMVRADVVARYGAETAYTAGYKVYTTLDAGMQRAATQALRSSLLDYDRRHGYRGPEARVKLGKELTAEDALADYSLVGSLTPGVVVAVEERAAKVQTTASGTVRVDWAGLEWAYRGDKNAKPAKAQNIVKPGDVVRLERVADGWRLAQIPEVEGALISLNPSDGAVLALVGGFDYFNSKFNRVIQAQRQPGSAFKPFIYSAALEQGFTPATLINDAPVVFQDTELESAWRPENYSGRFYGPTRLREALVHSRNLVSIRLLRAIGVGYALDYLGRFGLDAKHLPRDLSLALGSGTVTPLEMVRGYAVFANSGFLIEPYFVARIEDAGGKVLFEAKPKLACPSCETGTAQDASAPVAEIMPNRANRTIDTRNAYLMTSMMRDVIERGTAQRATALGRRDVAGKTGTTNDQKDAWFCGYNRDVVAAAWVGFDSPRPLGGSESGASAALPMWIDYMREALRTRPEYTASPPAGLVTVRINPETGLYAASGDAAIFETFYSENLPSSSAAQTPAGSGREGGGSVTDQLF